AAGQARREPLGALSRFSSARKKRPSAAAWDVSGGRRYLDLEPEILEPADEASRGLGSIAALEVISAEIAVLDSVSQHVIGRSQHRGRHGDDRLLRPAPALEPQELGAEIALLRPGGRPSGLNQHGLEPGSAVPRAGRATLPRTFVQVGAETRPRD